MTLSKQEKYTILERAFTSYKNLNRILIIPPDFTRYHSGAGELTAIIYEIFAGCADIDIIPALGTHIPMSEREIKTMFGTSIPLEKFIVHDWRRDLTQLGIVPSDRVAEWSQEVVNYNVNVEVNRILLKNYDLIISIGQVVPHEVVGMANYTKNICVGVGGADLINKSHFMGAAFGMERMMGKTDTPVRKLFNYAVDTFMSDLPICYVMSVVGKDQESKKTTIQGLFTGGEEAFREAADLSRSLNFDILDTPLKKVIVYLDPEEFKSTWLGNKAIYRTRMALADDGELIILAPGLKEFGEDPEIDKLIRKFGYKGTEATMTLLEESEELKNNLSAAAHLIHGSSEGRFNITYCPGAGITNKEIEQVGFNAGSLNQMLKKFNPDILSDGFNTVDGENIFFISNPAAGLWAAKDKIR